jgi:hypothetical protein
MRTTIGICLIILAMTTAAVAATPCPAPGRAAIEVHLEQAPVTIRADLNRSALSALAKGAAMGNHRGEVMGLTVANYALAYETEQMAQPMADGRWCARISKLTARLFLPETVVYVASDYPSGSCPYDEILAHERQHVAITEAELQRAGPRLETALRRIADQTLVVDSADGAESAIDQAVSRVAQGFVADLSERAHRANRGIDTKANYRQVAGHCATW